MTRAVALCGVLCLAAALARAQAPTGPEIELFSTAPPAPPSTTEFASDVAVRPDGAILVIDSALTAGSVVEARLFDPFGQPLGDPYVVANHAAGNWAPSVAVVAGEFVVVWESLDPSHPIYGRFLDASGAPVGSEFRVSEDLPDIVATRAPIVRSASDGRFVVAWNGKRAASGADVFARRYSAAGVAQGPAFHINSIFADDQSGPALQNRPGLGVAPDGSFVGAWRSLPSDPFAPRIFVDRFDASGHRLSEVLVSPIAGEQPSVAVAEDGSFLVAFVGSVTLREVFARAFAPSGGALAQEVVVSPPLGRLVAHPTAVATAGGSFTVVGEGASSGAHPTAFGRTILPSGMPAGLSFRVGNHDARGLSAAPDGQGGFVALSHAWARPGLPFNGFVSRRYGGLAPAGVLSVADPAAGPESDGNGILDPGENVGFRTAWSNFDAAAVSLTGQAVDFSGPPAASYTITDDSAAYGTIGGRASATCVAGGDCFGIAVSRPSPRPAVHWDATLEERLDTGPVQRWRVHIGETFADVPRSSPFYRFVEALVHNGVTSGCGVGVFCPGSAVTREQIAPFVLVAREGEHYASDLAVTMPTFSDVPSTSPFFGFVEELAYRGVVGGCGGGAYCPQSAVTRAVAAVIVLRTFDPFLEPLACATPVFADVPASSPFCRWVEEMARRGVMGGCGGGRFCPDDAITREQLAVVLARVFGLSATGW